MKILYIVSYFYPATHLGGPVAHLWAQAKAMARRGLDVSVLTSDFCVDGKFPSNEWVCVEGVNIYYASTGPLGKGPPYFCPAMRKEMKRSIPTADIVHLRVAFTFSNFWASRICGAIGKPYVYSPHGGLSPIAMNQKKLAKKAFAFLWERNAVRHAATRVGLNQNEVGFIRRFAGEDDLDCTVIPNGIILDELPRNPDGRAEALAKLNLPDNAIILLFMGRLQSIKGLDLLAESFCAARQRNDRLHLVLAGDDQGGKKIIDTIVEKTGVSEFVHFTGHVDGKDKCNLFEAADVFMLTSYSEGLPNGVLEACAYGLPCILTRTCNVPDVAEFDAGIICDLDADDIADAIIAATSTREKMDSMGANARKCVEERFSMDSVIDATLACYRDTLSKRSG